jgi:hypothetical protein
MISSMRDYWASALVLSPVFCDLCVWRGHGGRWERAWEDMKLTIGGHVKCSVRSIFSCCFAFAILPYILEWLSGNAAKSTCAVATRLGRVYLRPGHYWTAASAWHEPNYRAIPTSAIWGKVVQLMNVLEDSFRFFVAAVRQGQRWSLMNIQVMM